ncbi:hypothetical protein BN1007_180038 [Klebsiella variicola]|nr:hypothetical protein BN1007_180038 [Klebsiella variicola]CTQ12196.1 hypothetical protein BN1200_1580010 [Klebsiella variicola]
MLTLQQTLDVEKYILAIPQLKIMNE